MSFSVQFRCAQYHSHLLNASVYEVAQKKNWGGGGRREIDEVWNNHLKAFFKKSEKKNLVVRENLDRSTLWVLHKETSSFTNHAISALKHMRVCRYIFLALFYLFVCFFSLSVITLLRMIWRFLSFIFFSFGLNTYCTVELHWYVTFYYAFKSSFWKHTRW